MIYYARVSECLGGIRISNLHENRHCGYMNRTDAVGNIVEIDPAAVLFPEEIWNSLKVCPKCDGWSGRSISILTQTKPTEAS